MTWDEYWDEFYEKLSKKGERIMAGHVFKKYDPKLHCEIKQDISNRPIDFETVDIKKDNETKEITISFVTEDGREYKFNPTHNCAGWISDTLDKLLY